AYQVTAPKADHFLRAQCGVVHAGEERHESLAAASLSTNCGEQALRLVDVDDDARVHRLESARPCPLHALDGVDREDFGLACVVHHTAERHAFAVGGVRCGDRAVFLPADTVQQEPSAECAAAWTREFFQRDGGALKPAHNIGQVCWRLAFALESGAECPGSQCPADLITCIWALVDRQHHFRRIGQGLGYPSAVIG